MLHLAAYRGLEVLDASLPVDCLVRNPGKGTGTAVNTVINAGKMGITGHFRSFLDAQITGITINNLVILSDQIGCLGNITASKPCSGV